MNANKKQEISHLAHQSNTHAKQSQHQVILQNHSIKGNINASSGGINKPQPSTINNKVSSKQNQLNSTKPIQIEPIKSQMDSKNATNSRNVKSGLAEQQSTEKRLFSQDFNKAKQVNASPKYHIKDEGVVGIQERNDDEVEQSFKNVIR